MAKINIKQFCKEFKAYEEKVGKTAAWGLKSGLKRRLKGF